MIGDERLLAGWRLGFDLASLRLGVTSVMTLDLASYPVCRARFHFEQKSVGCANFNGLRDLHGH